MANNLKPSGILMFENVPDGVDPEVKIIVNGEEREAGGSGDLSFAIMRGSAVSLVTLNEGIIIDPVDNVLHMSDSETFTGASEIKYVLYEGSAETYVYYRSPLSFEGSVVATLAEETDPYTYHLQITGDFTVVVAS